MVDVTDPHAALCFESGPSLLQAVELVLGCWEALPEESGTALVDLSELLGVIAGRIVATIGPPPAPMGAEEAREVVAGIAERHGA